MPLPALKEDERVVISRKPNFSDEDYLNNTIHEYPYRTLPKLKSHLSPKFPIFDAGKKLLKLKEDDQENLQNLIKDYPGIEKTTTLYCAWIRKPPKNASKKKSYIDPDEELVHEDDIKKMLAEKSQFSEEALSWFDEQCEDSEGWTDDQIRLWSTIVKRDFKFPTLTGGLA